MSEPLEFEPLPTGEQWSALVDAWTHGWAAGVLEGERRKEAELAAIQRDAVASVRAAVTLPPRDAEADRAAAEKRAARWSQ